MKVFKVGEQLDIERYRASMALLSDIFKDMSETVNTVSTWRCPYKNAKDRCTAQFSCRNQLRAEATGELPVCTGSDNLDYRSAWDV